MERIRKSVMTLSFKSKNKKKKANLLGFRDPTWNDTSASRPCQSPALCLWGLKAEERNNACESPSLAVCWKTAVAR